MIVELEVSSSLVAMMVAIPLVFAPFRALIGFRSDTHKSAMGGEGSLIYGWEVCFCSEGWLRCHLL